MLLNRRVKVILGSVLLVGLASARGEVTAATLEVTATVPDSCTVTGGTLAFGEYDPSSFGDKTGSGEIDIECNSPAEVSVTLDGGLHNGAKGNGRAMKRANSEDYLNYRLYTEGLGQVRDPNVPVPVPGPLNTGSNVVVVDGVIDAEQVVPGGEYSDTVQITLTFN